MAVEVKSAPWVVQDVEPREVQKCSIEFEWPAGVEERIVEVTRGWRLWMRRVDAFLIVVFVARIGFERYSEVVYRRAMRNMAGGSPWRRGHGGQA